MRPVFHVSRPFEVCYCENYASASSDGACGAADWQHAGRGMGGGWGLGRTQRDAEGPKAWECSQRTHPGTLSLVGFAGNTARALSLLSSRWSEAVPVPEESCKAWPRCQRSTATAASCAAWAVQKHSVTRLQH